MRPVLLIVTAAIVLGCNSSHPQAPVASKETEYLSNGKFGIRLSRDGMPLPERCLVMLDEVVYRIPVIERLVVGFDGKALTANEASGVSNNLDYQSGVSTAVMTFPAGTIKSESVVDPEMPIFAQRISFEPKNNAAVYVDAPPVPPVTFQTAEPISREEAKDRKVEVHQLFDVSRGSGCQRVICIGKAPPFAMNFETIARRSRRFLADRWQTRIQIDGPAEDQRAVDSFFFRLYTNESAKLPSFGLSGERYGGHRFWDAEAYILPALSLVDPVAAVRATAWRVGNFKERYVWETGAHGKDLTPPEFREALHVAGWVAWWANRADALGLAGPSTTAELIKNAFLQFQKQRTKTERGIEFLKVESPDEGKLRNNDLTTNLLAKLTAQYAKNRAVTWNRAVIPESAHGFPATYDNDPLIRYQQIAALLSIYPLEWPFPSATQVAMFDRYKDKVSDAGPAMSDCFHAVIAARLGRADEAYYFWKKSWKEFTEPETMFFRERRRGDDGYFLTGAAGCLQSVIYGFLGVRISRTAPRGVPTLKLHNGYVLSVQPHLPKAWKGITFYNMQVLGNRYTVRATHEKVSIEKGGE